MSLADSEAAFNHHCNRADKSGALLQLLNAEGIKSFNALAFSVGTPQNPPDDDKFKEFTTNLNGGVEVSIAVFAQLRRIHFEASAIVVAELKSRVTSDAVTEVRKLPIAEKTARLQDQEARLKGVRIRGELQPSYALVDLAANIKDTNVIVWIPPSKCTKRDTEVQSAQKEKPINLSLEQQMIKLTSQETSTAADTSSDLQVQWCLQRRGLAFDQCSLISFQEHELWVQQLLNQLTREAPQGFVKPTIGQIIRADRELFTIMAQDLTSVQPKATGEFPMEESLKQLRTDPRVTMHLLPLPKVSAREHDSKNPSSSSTGHPRPAPKRDFRPAKKSKASAKAKSMCPDELKQYSQKTDEGLPICWAFNSKAGCKEPVQNGRCKKGVHCCIKCKRTNHSVITCRSTAS